MGAAGAIGLTALGAALWGAVGAASRLVSPEADLPPSAFAAARTVSAAVTLYAFAAMTARARMRRAETGFLVWAAAFGAGAALYNCFAFAALETVGVAVTIAVTMGAPPALTTVVDAARARRAPSALRCAAVAAAAAGVSLATLSAADLDLGAVGGPGALQLAAATAGWLIMLYAARAFSRRYDAIRATGAGMGCAAAMIGLAAALGPDVAAMGTALRALSLRDVCVLLYISVAATGLSYLFFAIGMRESRSVSGVAVAAMAEPATAALLAIVFLHERLDGEKAAGIGLIAAAMLLQAAADRPRRPAIGAGQGRAAT